MDNNPVFNNEHATFRFALYLLNTLRNNSQTQLVNKLPRRSQRDKRTSAKLQGLLRWWWLLTERWVSWNLLNSCLGPNGLLNLSDGSRNRRQSQISITPTNKAFGEWMSHLNHCLFPSPAIRFYCHDRHQPRRENDCYFFHRWQLLLRLTASGEVKVYVYFLLLLYATILLNRKYWRL